MRAAFAHLGDVRQGSAMPSRERVFAGLSRRGGAAPLDICVEARGPIGMPCGADQSMSPKYFRKQNNPVAPDRR